MMRTISDWWVGVFGCLFVISLAPANALAAQLFSYQFMSGFGTPADLRNSASIEMRISAPGDPDANSGPILFSDRPWTPADIGSMRTATAATYPDFNDFASELTDGQLEAIGLFDPGGGLAAIEPYVIWGNAHDPRVDLHGYRIDSITMRLDSITFMQDSVFPPPFTDVTYAITVSADGAPLPEPALASIAAVICTALIPRRH